MNEYKNILFSDSEVELVSYMPEDPDLGVVNSARVSYGKKKDTLDQSDIKLINYLAAHNHMSPFRHPQFTFRIRAPEFVARQLYKHCFSEDTEVLTENGWKFWSDITENDKLANVTKDNKYYFTKPITLIKQYYCGDMVEIKGRQVDQFVTDEHRLFLSKRNRKNKKEEFKFFLAKNILKGEYKLPLLPSFEMSEGNEKDYYNSLLYGFALAEGNFTATKNRIYFSVKNNRERHTLKLLESQLPNLNWRQHKAKKDFIKISCLKPDIEVFKGTCKNKSINFNYIKNTKKSYLGVLDGIFFGDGTITSSKCIRITTASEFLVRDIEKLCLYLGYRFKFIECPQNEKHNRFYI